MAKSWATFVAQELINKVKNYSVGIKVTIKKARIRRLPVKRENKKSPGSLGKTQTITKKKILKTLSKLKVKKPT